jgi:hypothetical protein
MSGRNKGGRKAVLTSKLRYNPCLGVEPPGTETARSRFLADAEIVQLWKACDDEGEPYAIPLDELRRQHLDGVRCPDSSGVLDAAPSF